ncbi:FkbM family methyltransferase [Pseudanabaena yagii]|uniref:FkbM family methyltransferase n=1 Tax=Pseudanabaena yagii GIHE-NHR1 TaxID=2722753 RepID=A0ABX1LKK0_9CYAN|nr:FkbM family methyltransferase [Pseudanabaena yagii GIHE-NHR1]
MLILVLLGLYYSDSISSKFTHAVSTTTLQSLLNFSGVKTITLMKIDVEGYELQILYGLGKSFTTAAYNH